MKHIGKARNAAWKLIMTGLFVLVTLIVTGYLARLIGTAVVTGVGALFAAWLLFVGFTLYFFRDPEARVPAGKGEIVSPAHGKVDVIDEIEDPGFMGGRCKRISIFLSVIDIHVQNAPEAGTVSFFKYQPGQFVNAMRTDSAACNENVLVGIDVAGRPGVKLGVRCIAGLIARRIVPFVGVGDAVERGGRIGLIQFGSRVELYLPLNAGVKARLGDRVVGGETVMATFQ